MSDPRRAIVTKRDGGALSEGEMRDFLGAWLEGRLEDAHAAALLTAIFVRGMEVDELETWTRAMLESGVRFDFSALGGPKLDKHSTGGVGDKVSIALAPAVAACGGFVPMISGRGLGHTGGTLDKLESIPGMRVALSEEELARTLERTGLAFGAQTERLVPADRRLYALRDATCLVESIPLIASSILSKKLAEGLDALVLDVKFGSGAFLPEAARGAELARTMVALAARFGLRACAYQTSMEAPLGRAVGHALEVVECVEVLQGGGPPDTVELVRVLGGELLHQGGLADSAEDGAARIGAALADGSALERLARVVAEQGGDAACVEDPARLAGDVDVERLDVARDGYVVCRDARAVGLAVAELGGGRRAAGDALDLKVGLVLCAAHGAHVRRGEPLLELHHRGGRGMGAAQALLASALDVVEQPPEVAPLVAGRIGAAAGG